MLVGGGGQRPKTQNQNCLKKEIIKHRHKITNVPEHKMELGVMNSNLANHLMGPVQGFKMIPLYKISTFRGVLDFFGCRDHLESLNWSN